MNQPVRALRSREMELVLGVHFEVPRKVGQSMTRARRLVDRYFGSQEFLPHLTLYLARFRQNAFSMLVSKLKKKPLATCAVKVDGFRTEALRDGRLLCKLEIQSSSSLLKMHRAVVRLADPLRRGLMRGKDQERIDKHMYTKAEARQIRRYGYLRVMSSFKPHVTIGTLHRKTDFSQTRLKLRRCIQPIRGFSWVPKQLVVGLYTYNPDLDRYVGRARECFVPLTVSRI